MPDGPIATILKVPEPVILQTILTSEFVSGGTPEVDRRRPQNTALAAVPCTSGPTEELSIGDAGWQCFRPGAVGPVIVGEGAGGDLCAAGGTELGEPVEHAATRVRSRNKKR